MKKVLCIFLSVSLLICLFAGMSIQADAASWPSYARNVSLDRLFTEMGYQTDPYSLSDGCYMDIFRFKVPEKGTITFKLKSKTDSVPCYHIFKTSDTENSLWFGYDGNRSSYDYDYSYDGFYSIWKIKLNAGSYYMMAMYGSQTMNVEYTYLLKYYPTFYNTSIISKASKPNAAKIRWTKSGKATGYKIQYSTNSNMKNAKTINIKSASTTAKTIKGLKSKKTYYFRVMAYKKVTVSGTKKTYNKKWSAIKSVKTK